MLIDFGQLKKEKDLLKAAHHEIKAARYLNENVAEEMGVQIGDLKMGFDIHFSTDGRWSLHDLIAYILKQTGPAELHFCTYAIKEYQARLFSGMKEIGLLTGINALVDYRIGVLDPGAEQLLKASCKSIGYMRTHAKLVVLKNEMWGIVIAGSANLTTNTRGDVGVITCSMAIADFRIDWITKNIQRGTDAKNVK